MEWQDEGWCLRVIHGSHLPMGNSRLNCLLTWIRFLTAEHIK